MRPFSRPCPIFEGTVLICLLKKLNATLDREGESNTYARARHLGVPFSVDIGTPSTRTTLNVLALFVIRILNAFLHMCMQRHAPLKTLWCRVLPRRKHLSLGISKDAAQPLQHGALRIVIPASHEKSESLSSAGERQTAVVFRLRRKQGAATGLDAIYLHRKALEAIVGVATDRQLCGRACSMQLYAYPCETTKEGRDPHTSSPLHSSFSLE